MRPEPIARIFGGWMSVPLLVAALAGACGGPPPENPAPDDVGWRTFVNETVGYSIEVPDVYIPMTHAGGRDVLFRYEGYPVIAISWVDEAEGRGRGLWPAHEPAGAVTLGGRPGSLYIYDHYDGPFGMHTVSRVVEHGGRMLGVELRTDHETPDPLQQRILESFRFTDAPADTPPAAVAVLPPSS